MGISGEQRTKLPIGLNCYGRSETNLRNFLFVQFKTHLRAFFASYSSSPLIGMSFYCESCKVVNNGEETFYYGAKGCVYLSAFLLFVSGESFFLRQTKHKKV
jgi:hypothetical protein